MFDNQSRMGRLEIAAIFNPTADFSSTPFLLVFLISSPALSQLVKHLSNEACADNLQIAVRISTLHDSRAELLTVQFSETPPCTETLHVREQDSGLSRQFI